MNPWASWLKTPKSASGSEDMFHRVDRRGEQTCPPAVPKRIILEYSIRLIEDFGGGSEAPRMEEGGQNSNPLISAEFRLAV